MKSPNCVEAFSQIPGQKVFKKTTSRKHNTDAKGKKLSRIWMMIDDSDDGKREEILTIRKYQDIYRYLYIHKKT